VVEGVSCSTKAVRSHSVARNPPCRDVPHRSYLSISSHWCDLDESRTWKWERASTTTKTNDRPSSAIVWPSNNLDETSKRKHMGCVFTIHSLILNFRYFSVFANFTFFSFSDIIVLSLTYQLFIYIMVHRPKLPVHF
jgi:hypothetical protein